MQKGRNKDTKIEVTMKISEDLSCWSLVNQRKKKINEKHSKVRTKNSVTKKKKKNQDEIKIGENEKQNLREKKKFDEMKNFQLKWPLNEDLLRRSMRNFLSWRIKTKFNLCIQKWESKKKKSNISQWSSLMILSN